MNLIFLGPPGAGKGTQAQRIMREFGVLQISTGDILRSHIKQNSELGELASKYIKAGELVPDDVIVEMIKKEINYTIMDGGYLLDGFPRTLPQAEVLENMLDERNDKIDAVLVLDVPNQEIIDRLSGRRVCRKTGKTFHIKYNPPTEADNIDPADLYQRDDDKEETVKNRLKVYDNQTKPLIDYYQKKGIAHMIDGTGNLPEVFNRINKILTAVHEEENKG